MKITLHSLTRPVGKHALNYLSLWVLMTTSFSALASNYTDTHLTVRPAVSKAGKPEDSLVPAKAGDRLVAHDSLEFEVQSISRRRFRISFNNRSGRSIFVKIYDVIGNLIKQEKINRKGEFKKEYDMSETHTEFYVIEVSNTQSSIVKRLFPTEATSL